MLNLRRARELLAGRDRAHIQPTRAEELHAQLKAEARVQRHASLMALVASALILYVAASAEAQTRDTAVSAPPTDFSSVALRTGVAVRIASPQMRRVEGRLLGKSDTTLLLELDGGERSIPVHVGDTVWVRGRATKRGAITGGVVGLTLLGTLAALLYATCKDGTDDPCTGPSGFPTGALVVVGEGVIIGALVGSLFPQWHRRYP